MSRLSSLDRDALSLLASELRERENIAEEKERQVCVVAVACDVARSVGEVVKVWCTTTLTAFHYPEWYEVDEEGIGLSEKVKARCGVAGALRGKKGSDMPHNDHFCECGLSSHVGSAVNGNAKVKVQVRGSS